MSFDLLETEAATYFTSEPELLLDWERNVYHVAFRCTATVLFNGDPGTIRKLTTYVRSRDEIERARRRLIGSIKSVFEENGVAQSEGGE